MCLEWIVHINGIIENVVFQDWLFNIFFLLFNWRIAALQYCTGFCHTSPWFSQRCTHVPLEPPSLPSRLGPPSHTENSHWPSVLPGVTSVFPSYSLHSAHPLLPTVSTNLFSRSPSFSVAMGVTGRCSSWAYWWCCCTWTDFQRETTPASWGECPQVMGHNGSFNVRCKSAGPGLFFVESVSVTNP